MTEIRLVKQEEMQAAIASSDRIFARDSDMSSMGEAFPFLFSATTSHSLGLFEDGSLLVFMGLVPALIRIGGSRVTVFSLGSVFTLPEARNRGLASQLLEEIKVYSRQAGVSILLVSGEGPLYARSGCRKFGEAYRLAWSRELSLASEATDGYRTYQMNESRHQDVLHLQRIAAKRYAAYEQSVWDFPLLLNTEAEVSNKKMKQHVYVARHEKKIVAFVVVALPTSVSKGEPYVVEWAGRSTAVAALLSHVVIDNNLDRLNIVVETHEREMLATLCSAKSEKIRNQGTVFLVDPEQLFRQLRPYLEAKDPVAGKNLIVSNTPDGGATFTISGLPIVALSSDELVSLLFDSQPEPDLPAEWNTVAALWFPIPFPYTGGLNYV
ncbi:GNAT family N-acetyltransferase [Cohnella lupini]|uniref:Acetyltransferase (GNAT) family protein n=1 Tax=Cohnella lupini TaxID=1294267 RepID=A0A3D9I355_9BACL|nr:GNAT family N-acetyltransferase [Cohnella lupini]RED55999.1 acetyltransferase (GNAT) family protein [Cohnella lupini]